MGSIARGHRSGCRATDQMTNFGYFSQAPSVNAGCPYTRPQTCIDRGAAPRVKKPYVSGQAPRRSVSGESFREDADYHSLHSFDAVRTPGVTAHKQGSFQTGFRDAKRPASSPFSSSSTNARGLNHCVGKRPVPLLVGSQIPRPGAKSAKGRPRFKRKVVIGDPMRLTQCKGDNYATQSRESFNGPCNRAQPNNLAPYKLGGGDDLFEEETLKGPSNHLCSACALSTLPRGHLEEVVLSESATKAQVGNGVGERGTHPDCCWFMMWLLSAYRKLPLLLTPHLVD